MGKITTLVAAALLCLFPVSVESSETVRIAAVLSKTGKAAAINSQALNGVRIAVAEVNRQGGILGKKLVLLEFDNQSTALGSRIAAQKAVRADVVTVFGAVWSSHSLAMAPVLQEAGIPMISPFSTNPRVTRVGDYIFRICYTDPFQGKILASFAVRDLKAKTAGILVNVDSLYSEDLADYFRDRFQELGGRILFSDGFLEKTADFQPFLDNIRIHQPDIVFLPAHAKLSAAVLSQAGKLGIKTVFIGGDGWNDSMYRIVGSAIEGHYYANQWHPDSNFPKSREFVDRYRRQNLEFGPGNALSEDCIFLFADAVKRAGSLDPARIRDAIAATRDFEGVTGTIRFDQNGDPIKSAVIMRFVTGKSTFVKSVDP